MGSFRVIALNRRGFGLPSLIGILTAFSITHMLSLNLMNIQRRDDVIDRTTNNIIDALAEATNDCTGMVLGTHFAPATFTPVSFNDFPVNGQTVTNAFRSVSNGSINFTGVNGINANAVLANASMNLNFSLNNNTRSVTKPLAFRIDLDASGNATSCRAIGTQASDSRMCQTGVGGRYNPTTGKCMFGSFIEATTQDFSTYLADNKILEDFITSLQTQNLSNGDNADTILVNAVLPALIGASSNLDPAVKAQLAAAFVAWNAAKAPVVANETSIAAIRAIPEVTAITDLSAALASARFSQFSNPSQPIISLSYAGGGLFDVNGSAPIPPLDGDGNGIPDTIQP